MLLHQTIAEVGWCGAKKYTPGMLRGAGGSGAGLAQALADNPVAALVVVAVLAAVIWFWWSYLAG